jgi:hypothetical protein
VKITLTIPTLSSRNNSKSSEVPNTQVDPLDKSNGIGRNMEIEPKLRYKYPELFIFVKYFYFV